MPAPVKGRSPPDRSPSAGIPPVQLCVGCHVPGSAILPPDQAREGKIVLNVSHHATRGLVLGNEVTGVDPGVLELCSLTLHIPMRGAKNSLNVATAMGIAAYALTQALGQS